MTPEEFAHEREVRQIMEARITAWLASKGLRAGELPFPIRPSMPRLRLQPEAPKLSGQWQQRQQEIRQQRRG